MRPRNVLALAAAIACFGALSSTIGVGALPTSSLPTYGVTNGDGSQMTVAQLGDVNGDHVNDYAVGMPYADANGADSGIVYVFLGRAGALPPTPAAIDLASASFRIIGHGGELLGFAVSGGDLNGDRWADIALGAPMAAGPGKAAAGAIYVVFGSASPHDVSTTTLSIQGYTNDPANPATPSPLGSRYEGFQVNSHTGTAVAVLPDVNGDHIGDLAVGMPDASLHRPGGGGAAVLYGKPQGVHINLADLWSNGYPYYFHVDFPSLDNQHVGQSVAGVPDMTGDGWPDIAVGAPQADYNGVDSGSVWIISGHLPPIGPGCSGMNVDATCPWIKLNGLTAAQGYRIDGAAPGDGIGSALVSAGDQNGDGIPDLAIGASAASPSGRANAGEVIVVAGQHGSATRNLAAVPPLQRIDGAMAGAGLGAALAAAGDIDGDGRIDLLAGAPGEAAYAGAVYLVRGAPGTVADLAQADPATRLAPSEAGAQTGSAVAGGSALDAAGPDALIAAPGSGGGTAYIVAGSGWPAPAPAPAPAPPPVIATPPVPAKPANKPTTKPTAEKKQKTLPFCPRKNPRARYHIVKGKRVKVKPALCRPRPRGGKATATTTAKVKS